MTVIYGSGKERRCGIERRVGSDRRRFHAVRRVHTDSTHCKTAGDLAPTAIDTESGDVSGQASLFDGPPGIIAALLRGSVESDALSKTPAADVADKCAAAALDPKRKKPRARKKSSAALVEHDDGTGTVLVNAEAPPTEKVFVSAKWEEHSARLQAHMLDAEFQMTSENTFLAVTSTQQTTLSRSHSAPCIISCGSSYVSVGPPKTPECWPCCSESESLVPPKLALPPAIDDATHNVSGDVTASSSARSGNAEQGMAEPNMSMLCGNVEIIPPERIIEWLVSNAVRTNDRLLELERRVLSLETENTHLREVIASSQRSNTVDQESDVVQEFIGSSQRSNTVDQESDVVQIGDGVQQDKVDAPRTIPPTDDLVAPLCTVAASTAKLENADAKVTHAQRATGACPPTRTGEVLSGRRKNTQRQNAGVVTARLANVEALFPGNTAAPGDIAEALATSTSASIRSI